MPSKFTFITPFFQRHGIGFLDVILKALNDAPTKSVNNVNENERHDQYEVFKAIQSNGKLSNLEKVIYLLPKDYKNHIGAVPLWKEFSSKAKLDFIKVSIKKTSTNTKQSEEDLDKLINYVEDNENKTFPDYCWLEKNWRNPKDLWHIINEFSLATQIKWFKKHSPLFDKNGSEKFQFVELDLTYNQLEEEDKVTYALKKWLENENLKTNTYINLWGVASSFQLAFHYLSWSSPRLKQSSFIKCTTVKTATDKKRFTPLHIIPTDKDLLSNLEHNNSMGNLSEDQQIAYRWLNKYKSFNDNFTIMILGPKGTGKTKVVTDVYDKENIISINCAQFQSNPELARSELFGHVKGAFTGATEDKDGAFENANERVLFLDEIHHLDKATQSMLLTALQTTTEGYFDFTPVGTSEPKHSKFQLIVASNVNEDKLGKLILPDLLDRITQRILKIDALKPGESIEREFNQVWQNMKFVGGPYKNHNPILETSDIFFNSELKAWLTDKKRVFNGNYRDLIKIAILCADYNRCKDDNILIKKGTSLVDYIEKNWKQAPKKKEISIENFLDDKNNISLKDITNEFKAKIVKSAELLCGDQKTAAKMLGITAKNLIEIKKREK